MILRGGVHLNPLMVQSLRLYQNHCPTEFIQTSSVRNTYSVIKQSSHNDNCGSIKLYFCEKIMDEN